jgi:hypothetical protein
MTYAFIENNEITKYPVHDEDIISKYPGTSFPRYFVGVNLETFGVAEVLTAPSPSIDASKEYVIEGTPEFTNDSWRQTWIVKQNDQITIDDHFEAKIVFFKGARSELLAQSDWTQSPDSPLTDEKKTEWKVYRQALRDIPSTSGYPEKINWPVKPE